METLHGGAVDVIEPSVRVVHGVVQQLELHPERIPLAVGAQVLYTVVFVQEVIPAVDVVDVKLSFTLVLRRQEHIHRAVPRSRYRVFHPRVVIGVLLAVTVVRIRRGAYPDIVAVESHVVDSLEHRRALLSGKH